MNGLVISVFVAVSVFVITTSSNLDLEAIAESIKWENLHESSIKLRTSLTVATKTLKEIVFDDDNPVVETIITAAVDESLVKYLAIMDKIDAEIQAKTLTWSTAKMLLHRIHDTYIETMTELLVELRQLSSYSKSRHIENHNEIVVALGTQHNIMKAFLMGDEN